MTCAQLEIVHTVKGMFEVGIGYDGSLVNSSEYIKTTVGIVLTIDGSGILFGYNFWPIAEHPRHLTQILGVNPANNAVDTNLTPLLAFFY